MPLESLGWVALAVVCIALAVVMERVVAWRWRKKLEDGSHHHAIPPGL